MYKPGDTILYGREGVCRINKIVTRKINNEDRQYYQLSPLDNHITILVPINHEQTYAKIRPILSKNDTNQLIKTMADIETIWINDKNVRKQKYNDIVNKGDHLQLVKLIKTLYLNKQEQIKKGKKFHIQDQNILENALNILYDEISVTLNIKRNQVLPFILSIIKINEK